MGGKPTFAALITNGITAHQAGFAKRWRRPPLFIEDGAQLPFNTTYWTGWPTANDPYTQPSHWWNSTHQMIHALEKAE